MQQESLYIQDEHHQLHLRHIWCENSTVPLLMLHGTIENGKIFYTETGKGLGCYLAEQGFDVYIVDFRGKGKSKPGIKDNQDHGQFEAITRDIPLFIEYVTQRTQQNIHVVCHSWGGVMFASALARSPELITKITSNICFGTKRSVLVKSLEKLVKVDLLWNKLSPHLAKRRGYIDAKRLKFGAESETLSFLQHCIAWVKPSEWHDPSDGFDYHQAAKQLNWPATWHLTGSKDKVLGHANDVKNFIQESNEKAEFSLLSKKNGALKDYDHIDILTDPIAVKDHFPQIVTWLKTKTKTN